MRPEEWLAKRRFHHEAYQDIARLVEAKHNPRLQISLCIPTLNESATIGPIVTVLKEALMDREPLLDEIAVIDSGSTDATCRIATDCGADVYVASEHVTEAGNRSGKGENLWKALQLLYGDIIVCLDGDIKNIHPRFVYGLVGPLLADPEIGFVKACYRRFIHSGRVTEILIRPLLQLCYPELAVITEPLSGECAGRRGLLEQLAYPTGYGVEIAHLIDVYTRCGLEAFAETDLVCRIHGYRETRELTPMAVELLQTVLQRADRDGVLPDCYRAPIERAPLVESG